MYVPDGNKHRFRLCEGRVGLETKFMGVLIASEEVVHLGQNSLKTGECGFEGCSLAFQQLDKELDYSCRTRKCMEYLGNSSAN